MSSRNTNANQAKENRAARVIQRAARRYLSKKYVINKNNGTLARNLITFEPIPIERAIEIATPTGLMRTWGRRWFVRLVHQRK